MPIIIKPFKSVLRNYQWKLLWEILKINSENMEMLSKLMQNFEQVKKLAKLP